MLQFTALFALLSFICFIFIFYIWLLLQVQWKNCNTVIYCTIYTSALYFVIIVHGTVNHCISDSVSTTGLYCKDFGIQCFLLFFAGQTSWWFALCEKLSKKSKQKLRFGTTMMWCVKSMVMEKNKCFSQSHFI